MKKLLVLTLVLGMASMASAALQISVGTNQDPQDSMIVIQPSDEISLGIWTNADIVPSGPSEGDWVLICDTAGATISGGAKIPYGDVSMQVLWLASEQGVTLMPDGQDGDVGSVLLAGTTTLIPASTQLFGGINFHCEGPGDVIITLAKINENWEYTGDVYDTLVIHQIPEPATIALLGLGGLLLKRRK